MSLYPALHTTFLTNSIAGQPGSSPPALHEAAALHPDLRVQGGSSVIVIVVGGTVLADWPHCVSLLAGTCVETRAWEGEW